MNFPIWLPLIEAFITSQSAAGAPATTCRARREHLAHMARRIPTSPEATGADELLAYFAAQAWAPETRRGRRTTMRVFWSWAVATGRLEHNIAEAIPRVKPGKPNPRPCPDAAYKRALLAAGQRERLMLRLSAELGLRRAEVAGIHARDVVDDLGGSSLIVHGKGGKLRTVPLPTGLGIELSSRAEQGGYLFPGDDGGHLSPRWVGKLVGRLLPEGLTMHTLRHRFASRAWANGVDVWVLQDLLGHASSDTTRRYVALPNTVHRAAIEQLAS